MREKIKAFVVAGLAPVIGAPPAAASSPFHAAINRFHSEKDKLPPGGLIKSGHANLAADTCSHYRSIIQSLDFTITFLRENKCGDKESQAHLAPLIAAKKQYEGRAVGCGI